MEPPRPEPGVSPGAKLRGAPGAALGHPWGQAPTNSLSSCPTLFLVVSLSVSAFLQISGDYREFPGMPGDSREVPGISGNARGFPEIPGILSGNLETQLLETQGTRGARKQMKVRAF